jgi:hypothetical protein
MKLPFPDKLAVTPCDITIEKEGLDEDGNPVADTVWSGNVIFTESVKRVLNPDNTVVVITGQMLIKGDIAPNEKVTSGSATVNPEVNPVSYRIHSCTKNKNPDGTVHSTYLELM